MSYGEEVRVVADEISVKWVRTIHLMSNQTLEGHWLTRTSMARRARILKTYPDSVNFHHLVMSWRIREPVKGIDFGGDIAHWRMVIWALEKGERVREQAQAAFAAYANYCGEWPERVLIHELPKGLEAEEAWIPLPPPCDVESVPLLAIDWVVPGFLVVGKI